MSGKKPSKIEFDRFFEDFLNGTAGTYEDYFEHVRSIWQQKNESNIFLTSYEE